MLLSGFPYQIQRSKIVYNKELTILLTDGVSEYVSSDYKCRREMDIALLRIDKCVNSAYHV